MSTIEKLMCQVKRGAVLRVPLRNGDIIEVTYVSRDVAIDLVPLARYTEAKHVYITQTLPQPGAPFAQFCIRRTIDAVHYLRSQQPDATQWYIAGEDDD